jgi:hypothetical protein
MKPNLLKVIMLLAVVFGLLPSLAVAQCVTDDFSISNTVNGNDDNLLFNDFSTLAGLEGVTITMKVTSLDVSGEFQGTSQTAVIPTADFVDTISLSNVNNPPAALTETDDYVGSSAIVQNQFLNFNTSNFIPLPNSSTSFVTTNLANFVGNGQFDLDVVSRFPVPQVSGANIQNFSYTLQGTVMVCPEFVPEPSRLDSFVALAMMALVVYRSSRRA